MTYQFGPRLDSLGVTFRLWAPRRREMVLLVEDMAPQRMERIDHGFFALRVPGAGPGTRYRFSCDGLDFPDPASRMQDTDSNGWSVVRADMPPPARWNAIRPWHEAIIAEIHIGTATPQGTFRALAERLDHYVDAGYTALEIMPIAEFPGNRNWGYDGVLAFAPEHAYGSPYDLRHLVDAAHERGLAVILDVVYNHFGSIDNFVFHYAPEFFSPKVETPWGQGIDFNNSIVRDFFYENVTMWLTDYDLDGLRFDSVHEIGTERADIFLEEVAKTARRIKPDAMLVLENFNNCASWLGRDPDNRPIDFNAQWNDDIYHVLSFLTTWEPKGKYKHQADAALGDAAKGLAEGFVHPGDPIERRGRKKGETLRPLPPTALVSFAQNHDQIGNRPDSARLPERVDATRLDFLHFTIMLAPQIPMFFMGEEGHLRNKFPFFVDLGPEATEATRKGREWQMANIFGTPVTEGQLPDPGDPATFEMAKIDWNAFAEPMHQEALARFRQLADWRRELVWPLLESGFMSSASRLDGGIIHVEWHFNAGTLTMLLNPNDEPMPASAQDSDPQASTGDYRRDGDRFTLAPWSVLVWSEHSEPGAAPIRNDHLEHGDA